jgi:hypothetical protein
MSHARTRIFIDFWNFQLNWNDRSRGAKIDWSVVPRVLVKESQARFAQASIDYSLMLDETLVYASYSSTRDGKLKDWLETWLDKQPSFRVSSRARKEKTKRIHCRSCGFNHEVCSECGEKFRSSPEKGVDSAIVTDLLSLGSEGAFDVAILLSSDADFVPAVEWVQSRGLKVINATWDKHGFDLARTCWASFEIDDVMEQMIRSR